MPHPGLRAALLAFLVSAPAGTAVAQVGSSTLDTDQLATALITANAGVKAEDIVLITGTAQDIQLLEDLAVQARRVGAHPLILVGSDRLERRMFVDVPSELDAQTPKLALELARIVDVHINVPTENDPGLLADIPAERFAARGKTFMAVDAAIREHGRRYIELNNELYPTDWRAGQFGLSREQLSDLFWSAVQVEPERLRSAGEAIRSRLENGSTVRITHPNGTDLEVGIEGRTAYVSDGVIDETDLAQGPGGRSVWLPAGEVYVTPVPGTARGKVVVDRSFVEGQEVRDLTLEFQDGRLTSMTAASGLDRLKAMYDAADDGKAEFAVIDIGLNPSLATTEGRIRSWTPAGMVTVGIGGNTWAGGENAVNFGWAGHLAGATVTIDGEPVVEDGSLKVASVGGN
ncbi:MAG TPA: aminopeptidase [Gemmatimonadota bacterium]|nr:aminopeptidase [Gemmatimonadota bacterium]